MKRTLVLILSVVLAISMSACYSSHHGHRHGRGSKGMPPGQAKKNIMENNLQKILLQDNKRKRNINIDLRDFSLLQEIPYSTKVNNKKELSF